MDNDQEIIHSKETIMKKITLLSVLVLLFCGTQAQITRIEKIRDTTVVKSKQPTRALPKMIKTEPIKAEPTKTDSTPVKPADKTLYYLSSAKVDIVTGNDNKELLSRYHISLSRPGGNLYNSDGGPSGLYDNTQAFYTYEKHRQEFKTNSTNQVILETDYQFPGSFPGGAYGGWRYYELGLDLIQIYGLELYISYSPNFILDAWKIDKVTLTMEFKDLTGKPHPTWGTVVVSFMAAPLLKDGNTTLKCVMDKFLLPQN